MSASMDDLFKSPLGAPFRAGAVVRGACERASEIVREYVQRMASEGAAVLVQLSPMSVLVRIQSGEAHPTPNEESPPEGEGPAPVPTAAPQEAEETGIEERAVPAPTPAAPRFTPKDPRTSREIFRRLAGSIPFEGEVPSTEFLADPCMEQASASPDDARD